ncbi:MAG: helix-turn-helix domain-containing protein [Bacillota bacterium]
MSNYILFFVGILIIIVTLIVLRKDMRAEKASIAKKSIDEQEYKLFEYIEIAEDIKKEFDEMSQSVMNELEKKIQILSELLFDAEEKISNLTVLQNLIPDNKSIVEAIPNNIHSQSFEQMNILDKQETETIEKREIARMYNQGYTASQIAKEMNKGIGEIQLILNLLKR